MSSLALMRFLESAPERYDAGMRLITLGRVSRLHAAIAEAATPAPGANVLEIGCGTGAVTERLIGRGARVTALDQNPEMLERARERLGGAPSVELVETTASEIDRLPEASFDAVVASLCLSEMSALERGFVLREAFRSLRPGGILAVADEVTPRGPARRVLHALARVPQAALGWLLAGSLSRPIEDLAAEVSAAGFKLQREQRWLAGGLALLVGERPS
jgi:demethylmenaquinone methyltransferase/2-methoxy-6-polyprenyl-1,4-benzoquinol methylase